MISFTADYGGPTLSGNVETVTCPVRLSETRCSQTFSDSRSRHLLPVEGWLAGSTCQVPSSTRVPVYRSRWIQLRTRTPTNDLPRDALRKLRPCKAIRRVVSGIVHPRVASPVRSVVHHASCRCSSLFRSTGFEHTRDIFGMALM